VSVLPVRDKVVEELGVSLCAPLVKVSSKNSARARSVSTGAVLVHSSAKSMLVLCTFMKDSSFDTKSS